MLDDPAGYASYDQYSPSYPSPTAAQQQYGAPAQYGYQQQQPVAAPSAAAHPQQPQYAHFASPSTSPDYSSKPSHQDFGSQAGRYATYNDHTGQTPMGQAYAARENPVPGAGTKKKKLFSLEFVSSKWSRAFFFLVCLQAVLCLAFEAYVLQPHPGVFPLNA